jgi:hypothetical protein
MVSDVVITPAASARLELLVRVGCKLVYEETATASLLLNLRPRTDPQQALRQEIVSFDLGSPSEEFADVHGKIISQMIQLPSPWCSLAPLVCNPRRTPPPAQSR